MIDVCYTGPKPQRILELPVPLLARSEKTGELTFVRDVPLPVEPALAEHLVTLYPETFRYANGGPSPVPEPSVTEPNKYAPLSSEEKRARLKEKVDKAVEKRWSGKTGKWQAKAYVTRHNLEEFVTFYKDPYGWRLAAKDQPPITDPVGQEASDG